MLQSKEYLNKRIGELENYLKACKIEGIKKTKEEINDKKFILQQRKNRKNHLKTIAERVGKVKSYKDYDLIYINYLHKSIKRSELTSEIIEKEEEYGQDMRQNI